MVGKEKPFWQAKKLAEMTDAEWESLCDGCGKCCIIKLQDEDSHELFYTDVVCRLLDLKTCKCTRYADRQVVVPDCIKVRPENIADLTFMPRSCAYRLLAEGEDLPRWHPLVSGRKNSVHTSGRSVRHRVISETEIDEIDLPDRIVDWSK